MAIFISMTLCTTIYLLVNVAYFSILSPFEMMASPAVANTVANLFLQVRRKRHKWGIKHHSMVLPDLSLSTPCLELTHAYSRTHIQFMHTRTGCWYHDELYIPYLVSFPHHHGQPVPWIMSLFVVCSVFGSINGTVLTSSRLYLVGARDKLLPSIFSMIHMDKFTPVPAIIIFTGTLRGPFISWYHFHDRLVECRCGYFP